MPISPDFQRLKTNSELLAEARKPGKLPETGWYQVLTEGDEGNESSAAIGGLYNGETALLNSWEHAVGDNAPASWHLSASGEVRLRGRIKNGGDNTVAFILPEETRPEFEETFICPTNEDGHVDLSQVRFRAFQEDEI